MECIICGGPMETKVLEGVEIDYCPKCGGVWLDGGELQSLSGLDPGKSRVLTCATCGGRMDTRVVSGVEIDVCPGCGYVWLDKGELEKISGINPETGKVNVIYEFLRPRWSGKRSKGK